MTFPSICVITPTTGRNTLGRTLTSATPWEEDEWIVIGDGPQPGALQVVNVLHCAQRDDLVYIEGLPSGNYGNHLRDMAMMMSDKDYFLFLDDDDEFVPGVWILIKRELVRHRPRPVMFRMTDPLGNVLWREQVITPGNVGGSMFCLPNIPGKRARWGDYTGHGSDVQFIEHTLALMGGLSSLAWSGEIIIRCKPERVKI